MLGLLLAVQTGVLAHQVDHALNADGQLCAVCTVGGELKHATADLDSAPEAMPAHRTRPASGRIAPAHAHDHAPSARGPPQTR